MGPLRLYFMQPFYQHPKHRPRISSVGELSSRSAGNKCGRFAGVSAHSIQRAFFNIRSRKRTFKTRAIVSFIRTLDGRSSLSCDGRDPDALNPPLGGGENLQSITVPLDCITLAGNPSQQLGYQAAGSRDVAI